MRVLIGRVRRLSKRVAARRASGLLLALISIRGLLSDGLWWAKALGSRWPWVILACGLLLATVDLWWPHVQKRFSSVVAHSPGSSRVGPVLSFAQPQVSNPRTFWSSHAHDWNGCVVVFHVVNEGDETAHDCWASIRVWDENRQTRLNEVARARWPNDTPHPVPGQPSVDVDIPANGRPHAIDSVAQATMDDFDRCWLITDEGLLGDVRQETWAVNAIRFIIEMTVGGANVSAQTQWVRVQLRIPTPEIEVIDSPTGAAGDRDAATA
jgi:hypothetical protein